MLKTKNTLYGIYKVIFRKEKKLHKYTYVVF